MAVAAGVAEKAYPRSYFTTLAWEPILEGKHIGQELKFRANCFDYALVVDTVPGPDWQAVITRELDKTERFLFPPFYSSSVEPPEEEDLLALAELSADAFRSACSVLESRHGIPAVKFCEAAFASLKYRFLLPREDAQRALAQWEGARPYSSPYRGVAHVLQIGYATIGFALTGFLALFLLASSG